MKWGAGIVLITTVLVITAMAPVTTLDRAVPGVQIGKTLYAFVGVHVVPMDEERVLENQTVIVADDRVVRVGPVEDVDVPREATTIDGSGLYLMPGLSEMHAHIPSSRAPEEYIANTLFLYVANGITTIRGMLGEASHLELRRAAADGEILAPRVYTSGPSLNGNSVGSPAQA
ncbi:MAG: amidohydrolase, partial [Gemmatimonadota bacterium]